jgi:hypothetical protein
VRPTLLALACLLPLYAQIGPSVGIGASGDGAQGESRGIVSGDENAPRLPNETGDQFHARVAAEMRATLNAMPLAEVQRETRAVRKCRKHQWFGVGAGKGKVETCHVTCETMTE